MDVETAETQQTYNAVAEAYWQRGQDRRLVDPLIDAFVAAAPPQGKVLDIGCGPGYDGAILKTRGLRVTGVDFSAEMCRIARKTYRLSAVVADMRQLPFVAGQVDGIWAMASLLHLPRPAVVAVLRGFKQTLVPAGVFLCSVKQGDGAGYSEHTFGRKRFYTYWQPDTLDSALSDSGFTIKQRWHTTRSDTSWITRLCTSTNY